MGQITMQVAVDVLNGKVPRWLPETRHSDLYGRRRQVPVPPREPCPQARKGVHAQKPLHLLLAPYPASG